MAIDVFSRARAWATSSTTVERWRRRRYELFMQRCAVQPGEAILDVGAGAGGALERFNSVNPITAFDRAPRVEGTWLQGANVRVQSGDATSLPFADRSFPLAFSSSVIQYVPPERRPQFAAEIRRVSERYFVQTPNRYFPIDPHYQLPFVQFLPRAARDWLTRYFTIGFRGAGSASDFSMLTARELRSLFPEAEIHRERVLGLTKSLMAIHGAAPHDRRAG